MPSETQGVGQWEEAHLHGQRLVTQRLAEAELAAHGLAPGVHAPVHGERGHVRRARRHQRDRRALQRRHVARREARRHLAEAELAGLARAPAVDVALGRERERVAPAARDLRDGAPVEHAHHARCVAVHRVAVPELAAHAAAQRVQLAVVRERGHVLGAEGDLRQLLLQATAEHLDERRVRRAGRDRTCDALAREDHRAGKAAREVEHVLSAQLLDDIGRAPRLAKVEHVQVARQDAGHEGSLPTTITATRLAIS